MKVRRLATTVLLLIAVFAASLTTPPPAGATDTSSHCKWPMPWPTTIRFRMQVGISTLEEPYPFSFGEATKIEYAAYTWNAIGSNLILQPEDRSRGLYATNGSKVRRDYIYYYDGPFQRLDTSVGIAYISADDGCFSGPDRGRFISVVTVLNQYHRWHDDCGRVAPFCEQNGYFDVQNAATHEFGHWFHLYDQLDGARWYETMNNGIVPGETHRSTLDRHDIDSALIMYGGR